MPSLRLAGLSQNFLNRADASCHIGQYFTGLIDEVKIFSRALGHDEVLEIFRSTVHNGKLCVYACS